MSDPSDASELEAERIAASVVRDGDISPPVRERTSGRISRACAECAAGGSCSECAAKEEEDEVLRSAETGAGPVSPRARAAVDAAVTGGGAPLPAGLRGFYGDRMRASLDHVRVHTGPAASRAARSLSARAFTVGNHVVFGAGEFRPETGAGRELIAHELVHTLQNGKGVIRRQRAPAQSAPPAPAQPAQQTPAPGTAAARSRFDLRILTDPEPCACVVFIHNNERNARRTVELMRTHCNYNIAMMEPDFGDRNVETSMRFGRRTTNDPNEFFPRDIADLCVNDPQACQTFITQNEGATDAATIRRFVLINSFMAIHECSRGFTLPVVALHNNVITDTALYRSRRAGALAAGRPLPNLPTDVAREPPPRAPGDTRPPPATVDELRRSLRQGFGADARGQLEGDKMTNIFRWCAAPQFPEIARCHIGDRAHPDNVVWTTNVRDFERLSAPGTNVNVVLQTRAAQGGESDTDLSTLFIHLREVIDRPILEALMRDVFVSVTDLIRGLAQLAQVPPTHPRIDLVDQVRRILSGMLRFAEASEVQAAKASQLRFLNIETPGSALPGVTPGDQRVENFRFIISALRTLGLACCGEPGGTREQAIETGLRAPLPPVPRRPRRP